MKIVDFAPGLGRQIEDYGSDFRMSRLIQTDAIHVGCMYLKAGGLVGYHRASAHQLFVVTQGDGWVREGSARRSLRAGQAAFWSAGEFHEAGTDTGMMVIVIEGEVLSPAFDIGLPAV